VATECCLILQAYPPSPVPTLNDSVKPVEIPAESAIARFYELTNLADAYSVKLPAGTVANPELLARFIFSQQAPWIKRLMKIRDALVAGFGLKTSAQLTATEAHRRVERVGIFKIYNTTEHEIILGEDDKHLDFRLSVLCPAPVGRTGERHLVLSTVVHCHNRLGRAYIFVIAPFHRVIVQACLRRAARIGWPQASPL
jgi:Protein of unknown function (DUF2867)